MLESVDPAPSAGQFSDLLIIRVHKNVFFHGGGSGTAYCLTYVGGEGKKVCLLPDFRWGRVAVPEAVDCYMSARSPFKILHFIKLLYSKIILFLLVPKL